MKKVLEILRRLLRCPLEFPVEALMGLSFFLIAAYNTYHGFGHAPLATIFSMKKSCCSSCLCLC